MTGFIVRLFGKFGVWCGDDELHGLAAYRAQELLSYVLLHADRPVSRDVVCGALWAEASAAHARKYLRQALWQLQAAMANEAVGALVEANASWIWLAPHADVWVDVAVLDRAAAATARIPGSDLDAESAGALQAAVELYRGDLLEGWYHEWCSPERERLLALFLSSLDKLMDHSEAGGDYESGLVYGARSLSYDRGRERTHRQLMRLHHLAGDRTAALRQYERCAASLREELGVRPSARTIALYEQIRADNVEIVPLQSAGSTSTTLGTVSEMLAYLKKFHATLADFQRRLRLDIETLESAPVNRGLYPADEENDYISTAQ